MILSTTNFHKQIEFFPSFLSNNNDKSLNKKMFLLLAKKKEKVYRILSAKFFGFEVIFWEIVKTKTK